MAHDTLLVAAIIFLAIPTVVYGDYFLAGMLKHKKTSLDFLNILMHKDSLEQDTPMPASGWCWRWRH